MANRTNTPLPEAAGCAGKKLSAVVFDLDGVLIHSAPCHRDAFIEVLYPLGITTFEYSRFAGWRTRDVVVFVLAEVGIECSESAITEAAEAKSRRARELMAASNPVAKGCVELLRELADRGYELALASSGSRESVQMFLDSTGTAPMFRSVLTGGDVALAKPDPEIYTRTFLNLNLPPQDCLVIEDAVAGVQAACAAGSSAIGVAGSCHPDELRRAGALDILDNVADLPDWIGRREVYLSQIRPAPTVEQRA